ncbi:hypothetical protein J3P95_11120 [Pseudomonas sp. Z5-35]|uniref:hypothetical protein n=1 Tax=unclassified Pseudomonas TaxID=196821 RepID=UPI003DA93FC5
MSHQQPGIRFSDVETAVPSTPGLYQIIADDGELLKVGISGDLRKRLIQHQLGRNCNE